MAANTVSKSASSSSYWWVLLLEGVAALVLGFMLFLQPATTLVILTTFLGAYWLVDGIFKVIGALRGQQGDRSWWMLFLAGLLGIIAGALVLSQPLLSTLVTQIFLVYLLAAQALIGGLISIFWALRHRHDITGEGWIIVSGILAVALGLLLFSSPLMSILTLAWVVATIAILGGAVQVVAAFRWRSQNA